MSRQLTSKTGRGRSAPPARRRRRGLSGAPLIWILPAIAFAITFRFAPAIAGAQYSLTNWDGISSTYHWVGLDNYVRIFSDSTILGSLVFTIALAIGTVILTIVVGMLLALGLDRVIKTRNVLRTLYFIPVVLMPLAAAYSWRFIFDRDGLLNTWLNAIGLGHLASTWLGNAFWAQTVVLMFTVWNYVGFAMSVFLAGLQSVPEELHEAAAIDGASTWRRFVSITLPMMAPAVTVVATLSLAYGLRAFDAVVAITAGGPAGATETLATQIWKRTFQFHEFGLGSALAVVFAVLVTAVTLAQLVVLRRGEKRIG